MTKIYIAGPMTGLPDLNYPAFHAAAAELRAQGHQVENPAENPAPACGSWNGYMRLAIAQLTSCEAIYLLPGWSRSKGARLEYRIARDFGLMRLCTQSEEERPGILDGAAPTPKGIKKREHWIGIERPGTSELIEVMSARNVYAISVNEREPIMRCIAKDALAEVTRLKAALEVDAALEGKA